MTRKPWLILVVISVLITACAGRAHAGLAGDAYAGEALFHQASIREAPACSACHAIEPGVVIVGPSLAGVASRAGDRKPGLPAEAYLRESILDPNAYIVVGFSEGVMYQKYGSVLTEVEINDLLAYLLTLE